MLVPEETKWGVRHVCTVTGCTVAWWPGCKTSTPADAETRAARRQAHDSFDVVWKSGVMRRNAAYRGLARHLGLRTRDCHIGMFDKYTCMRVIIWSRNIRALFCGEENDDKTCVRSR